MTTLFSIAIVTYNAGNVLAKTFASIRTQTFHNYEVVIIDGGSSDDTMEICKQNSDLLSICISEPDKGIYDAMNKAFRYATGDYILFLGAGDVFYDNDVLQNMAASMTDKYSIYYGNVIFRQINKRHWGEFNKYKFCITNICHQCIFYPKTVYKNHSYDLMYKVYADYEYNLRMYGNYKFKYINVIVVNYDMAGFSYRHKDVEFEKIKRRLLVDKFGYFAYVVGLVYRILLDVKHTIIKQHIDD